MIGPASRLKELGQLSRNVENAAVVESPLSTLAHELADWVRCATGIIGELVLDGAIASEPKGEPASCSGCGGDVVDEMGRPLLLVEPLCWECGIEQRVAAMEGHS